MKPLKDLDVHHAMILLELPKLLPEQDALLDQRLLLELADLPELLEVDAIALLDLELEVLK